MVYFALGEGSAGPAQVLYTSGVDGSGLLTVTGDVLVHDVRLTPLGAREVLAARDAFPART